MTNIRGYQPGQIKGSSNTSATNLDSRINRSNQNSELSSNSDSESDLLGAKLNKRKVKKIKQETNDLQEALRKISKNPNEKSIQNFIQDPKASTLVNITKNFGKNDNQTSQIGIDLNDFSQTEESIRTYLAPAFNSISAIGSRIYKGKRGDTLLKSITDKLLFETTKNFISDKLQSQNAPSLNTITSLSYIQFLTSLDPRGTEEFLKNEPGCKLIPNTSDDSNDPVTKFDKFVRNLGEIVHPEFLPGPQDELSPRSVDLLTNYEGSESKQIIKDIYSSLMLGKPTGKHGNRPSALPIDKSPYAVFGQENILSGIAKTTYNAFDPDNNAGVKYTNIAPEKFKYNEKKKQYVSKHGKLHIAVRKFQNLSRYDQNSAFNSRDSDKISIVDAERLGLITPEKARQLTSAGHQNVKLICVVFRPTQNWTDIGTDLKNITNGVPKVTKYADVFVDQILNQIEADNDSLQPGEDPSAVVLAGHSMGGLFAQTMGVKYDCPSVVFNPLGPSDKTLEFAEKDNMGKNRVDFANSSERALTHQNITSENDWVAFPNKKSPVNHAVFKPSIGQQYYLPVPKQLKERGAMDIHNGYFDTLDAWQYRRQHSSDTPTT